MPYSDPVLQLEAQRRCYRKHKSARLEWGRKWYLANKARKLDAGRAWRKANREKAREIDRRTKVKNRGKYAARELQYRIDNRDKARARHKWRMVNDLNYRIKTYLRIRICHVLMGRTKSASTMVLLGCSIENFKMYLESKFEVGMTWENYGKAWHLDHIMPCAIFDLTKPEHQRRCFHFSNMQPLFARDNWSKGAKVLTNQFSLL